MKRSHKVTLDGPHTLGSPLFWLVLLVAMPGSDALQPVQAQGRWVYEEDLQDRRADGWELERREDSGWTIRPQDQTDNFVLYGSGYAFARYVEGAWDDYRFRARVRLEGPGPIRLNYRSSDQGRYFVGFHLGGLALSKEAPLGTFHEDLTASDVQYERYRWYTIDIVGEGPHIEVFVDGRPVLGYDDPRPLLNGGISFETLEDAIASVDDIQVEVLAQPPATTVQTREPTPTRPVNNGNGLPAWFWIAAALLASGVSFGLGRRAGVKSKLSWTEQAHLQWHVEAENQLPEPQTPCTWACQVNVSADLLDRWEMEALELSSAMRLRRGRTPPPKRVEGDALEPLQSLTHIASIGHRRDLMRERLAPVVDALLQEVLSWKEEGQTPPSIRLDAYLKAPIDAEFKLYHCRQSRKGPMWVERLKWKRQVNQPGGEFVGVFRGPTAGEPDFAGRARQELEACLLDLISIVRFKL